jgi:uncharacterized protein (TIGR02117 family)
MNRQHWKWIGRIVGYGAGTIGMIGLAGALLPRRWQSSVTNCGENVVPIYVAGDAMHVNLILPVQNAGFDWHRFLALEKIGADAGGTYHYLKFGWGDREFYMNTPTLAEIRLGRTLRTLFAPGNPTAIYVEGYSQLPNEPGVTLRCIALERKDYKNLVAFLQRSFVLDAQGQPQRLRDGFGATSGFYAGTGHYSILRTCNTWAADGLDAANLNTPLWSVFAPPVMRQLRGGCPCS